MPRLDPNRSRDDVAPNHRASHVSIVLGGFEKDQRTTSQWRVAGQLESRHCSVGVSDHVRALHAERLQQSQCVTFLLFDTEATLIGRSNPLPFGSHLREKLSISPISESATPFNGGAWS